MNESHQDPTLALLLLACQLEPSAVDQALVASERTKVDWPRLFRLAYSGGLAGFLARHLALLEPPEPTRRKILAVALRCEARNRLLLQQALALCERALAQGLRLVPLKGAALLLGRPYPDLALREICDVDLLAHPGDWPALQALFLAEGYRFTSANKRELSYAHHATFEREVSGQAILVELHWTPTFGFYGDRKSDLRFLERTELVRVGPSTIPLLQAEDMFLSLALHLAFHRFRGQLKWLVDLVEYARFAKPSWPVIYSRAEELGASRALFHGLELSREAFGLEAGHLVAGDRRGVALARLCPMQQIASSATQPAWSTRLVVDLLLHDSWAAGAYRLLVKGAELGARVGLLPQRLPFVRPNLFHDGAR
jgi:hypothetical protein